MNVPTEEKAIESSAEKRIELTEQVVIVASSEEKTTEAVVEKPE